MMDVDWDARAKAGTGLQAVIDPGDRTGLKNALIDRIQWERIGPWVATRRELLDFGCGVGRFAQRVIARGTGYTGSDASAAMIDAARTQHRGTAAVFAHVPVTALPWADSRFDGVLTVGVLQCLKAGEGGPLRATLAELARVLVPGGELLLVEQASASGGMSGSVSHSMREQDYLDALAPAFDVQELDRIRFGRPSRLSAAYISRGAALPGRDHILAALARREMARARAAGESGIAAQVYYDVAIRALRRRAA